MGWWGQCYQQKQRATSAFYSWKGFVKIPHDSHHFHAEGFGPHSSEYLANYSVFAFCINTQSNWVNVVVKASKLPMGLDSLLWVGLDEIWWAVNLSLVPQLSATFPPAVFPSSPPVTPVNHTGHLALFVSVSSFPLTTGMHWWFSGCIFRM